MSTDEKRGLGRPPKSIITVTPRKNDVLAKRLAGNPHRATQRAIPLKEPHKWQLYIGNDYNHDDDLYRLVHELGWIPLEAADLACDPKEIGYRVRDDGYLVRGPQGREVVFKMDKADYALLQQRQTEANNATQGSSLKTKAAAAEAVTAAHGPEAGEFVAKHLSGTITDTVEPLPQ